MDERSLVSRRRDAVWLDAARGDLAAFETVRAAALARSDWPLAAEVAQDVPIYDGAMVRKAAAAGEARRDVMAEWVEVLAEGPGIIVIRDAMPDRAALDRATEIFEAIIARERAAGGGGGDHFARPGDNDRIWNALEKHCLADPENFTRYYASDAIALASEAWLGRGYQVTAQVNRVNPGGAPQIPHRDYHLGFMSPAQMAAFPAHIHRISPVLTLQGAVAHCDMPLESGPTLFLPGSQRFFEGYLAFGRPEFQACFAAHRIQLSLAMGDAVFFNPAVMHGAGGNVSADILRMANLLQVSSAFGRAMERVDRPRMVAALYAPLLEARRRGDLDATGVANAIAASAEGYAFPTDLDRDPPVGGLAPQTEAELLAELLAAETPPAEALARLAANARRRGGG